MNGAGLRDAVRQLEWVRDRRNHDVEEANRWIEKRWNEMGLDRHVLHLTGAHMDLSIQTLEGRRRGDEHGGDEFEHQAGAIRGKLDLVDRSPRPSSRRFALRRKRSWRGVSKPQTMPARNLQFNAMTPAQSHKPALRASISA